MPVLKSEKWYAKFVEIALTFVLFILKCSFHWIIYEKGLCSFYAVIFEQKIFVKLESHFCYLVQEQETFISDIFMP
jgi:hypothetical protein